MNYITANIYDHIKTKVQLINTVSENFLGQRKKSGCLFARREGILSTHAHSGSGLFAKVISRQVLPLA